MNKTKPRYSISWFQYYFPDEKSCLNLIKAILRERRNCLKCSRVFYPDYTKVTTECRHCGHAHITIPGTLFQNSRLPLHARFAMLWLLTIHKRPLNNGEIMKRLELKSYRITWQWLQKIREQLTFFPGFPRKDSIETDSFTFNVKSKSPSGEIHSAQVEILIIISRLRKEFRLLKMNVISGLTVHDRNQLIRDALPHGGVLYVPEKALFYSDERGFYKVRSGKKNHIYSPHCKLPLPSMVAAEWHQWVKTNYRNNIQEDHLQGYLNAFVFHFNRPGKTKALSRFEWIVAELLKEKETAKTKTYRKRDERV